MSVAIIGDGLLARSIQDVCDAREIDAACWGHDDLDVATGYGLDTIAGMGVAINTAALHRLGQTELAPKLARAVNEEGARNVARLVPTVYISTDYVFNDGGPHDESLPGEQPRSVYGQTKLAGELATLEHGGIVVRVAALFGHHKSHKGPTFPETILSSHDPIRLPTDQVFSPTYAPDAAQRIVDLALWLAGGTHYAGQSEGIYHAANDGSTSWAAFGQEIADLTRHDRHISGYEAKDPLRPRNSSLVSTRLPPLRHWRSALLEWETKRPVRGKYAERARNGIKTFLVSDAEDAAR